MQSWQTVEDPLFTPQTLQNQYLLMMIGNTDYKHQFLIKVFDICINDNVISSS